MIDFFSINLRKHIEQPVYKQLAEVFYGFIEKGILKTGNKLPSIRELSSKLNVNNDTVINAYKYLEKRKAVYTIKGSGTYVSDLHRDVSSTVTNDIYEYNNNTQDTNNYFNFYGTNISKNLFPHNSFKYIISEIFDIEKGNSFAYAKKNEYKVPDEIKNILLKPQHIDTKDSSFFYTDGSEQNTASILKSIARTGETIIGLGFMPASLIEKIISMGYEFHKFDICEKIDIASLEQSIKMYKPSAVYILTNANPSVSYLSNEDKKAILLLAAKYSFYIVEDDSFGCINYMTDCARSYSFKSFDIKRKVLYVYSFQKASISGLPIGFVLLPKQFAETAITSPSPIIKKSLEKFLVNGYSQHINELQEVFKQKLSYITDKLCMFDTATIYTPKGGCVLWLKFSNAETANYICNALLSKKIIVTPGNLYSNSEFFETTIQIGFGETEYLDMHYCLKEFAAILCLKDS